jgi:hypothetical protein
MKFLRFFGVSRFSDNDTGEGINEDGCNPFFGCDTFVVYRQDVNGRWNVAPMAGSGRNQSKATRATRATMKAVPWLKDDSQVCREKRRLSLEHFGTTSWPGCQQETRILAAFGCGSHAIPGLRSWHVDRQSMAESRDTWH